MKAEMHHAIITLSASHRRLNENVRIGSTPAGSIRGERTAGIGAEQKLTLGIGCFRFCPTAVIRFGAHRHVPSSSPLYNDSPAAKEPFGSKEPRRSGALGSHHLAIPPHPALGAVGGPGIPPEPVLRPVNSRLRLAFL